MKTSIDPFLQQLLAGAVALAASLGLTLPAMPGVTGPEQPPPRGDCAVEEIAADIGVPEMDTVLYCDGEWAQVGQWQTDYILTPHFDGDRWVVPPYDGEITEGLLRGCYTQEHIDALGGAPAEAGVVICDPAISTLY